jgi:hypothetical protein
MRDRPNDLGAILVILLGAVLGGRFYGSFFPGDGLEVVVERRFNHRDRFEWHLERPEERFGERYGEPRFRRPSFRACAVPFQIDSRGPGWSVGGEYAGRAWLTPEGLELEVARGTVEADRPADVRGIVFGLAEWTGESSWIVTHRAEPIPLGHLEAGDSRSIGSRRLLVPGIGRAELAEGWLVVEHVLNDSEAGGTAWTYAHARPEALAPLALGCLLS